MSKVDEELTRRFHRAERPVGAGAPFEALVRRRHRREILRRAQAGGLAIAVLAATVGGFLALQRAFNEADRDRAGAPSAANGEIVFAREGDDGRFHLFASQPDGSGVRQITDDATNDTDPAVSPDGQTIAYVHELDQGVRVIASVPIIGGTVTWHTSEDLDAADPAWSSDGGSIAFVGWAEQSVPTEFDAPLQYRAIFTVDATGGSLRRLTDGGIPSTSDPTWSPDGRSITFAGGSCASSCRVRIKTALYTVDVSSTDVRQLSPSSDGMDDEAPAWSPDGTHIAFTRPGEQGDEVWTIAPDGSDETLLATAVEASLEPDLAWAPDGSALLVSDGEWIYRVDATPAGDPDANFMQLVKGVSPSWQPLPAGSEPQPSPEPTMSPDPEPEGKDVGLGFNLCDSQRLGGIDFLGDGTEGAAWIGFATRDDGTCPRFGLPGKYVVAADHTGDGDADSWLDLPWKCYVQCALHDATDLDGNGSDELVVASYFSIMDYYVMTLVPGAKGQLQIRPILVAEPGHEPAGLVAGEPLRIDAGGDAGYGSQIECEGYPDAPVLVWSWSNHPVDSARPREVHITRLQFQADGRFHVIGTNDYSVPADQPSGIQEWTDPACGVDWNTLP